MAVRHPRLMTYLLDTHTFIWLATRDRRLSRAVIDLTADPGNDICLSVISRWEIVLKQRRDPELLPEPFEAAFARSSFSPLDLGFDVPGHLAKLPYHHNDPFDRLIVAHAMSSGCRLVSRDGNIQKYDVPIFW